MTQRFPRSCHVDPDFLAFLKTRYHVLDTILLLDYDNDFAALQQHLVGLKIQKFAPQDRIVISHFDTDYYVHNQFGVNLTNLFNLWQWIDIPLHVMLLYTNHFGIQREIDLMCQDQHPANQPTLIQTLVDPTNYQQSIYDNEPELDAHKISRHGMAMMGRARSHRHALYNHLAHLNDKLALTVKANA